MHKKGELMGFVSCLSLQCKVECYNDTFALVRRRRLETCSAILKEVRPCKSIEISGFRKA